MSAATSLHALLTSQATSVPSEEGDVDMSMGRIADVQPFIPLFTRLLHAQVTRTSKANRIHLQDVLFDQPDATVGKQYAVAFRRIASFDDILQKASSHDTAIFPDAGDELARIESVLGTLHRAIASREGSPAKMASHLPWGAFANPSHALELKCILCHALARDWLALPSLVPVLLATPVGTTLLVGIVENDPSAFPTVLDLILATFKKADADLFDTTHAMLLALGALSPAHAMRIRAQCIESDTSVAAVAAIDLTCSLVHDEPTFVCGLMRGGTNPAFWSVVTDTTATTTTPTPVRAKAAAVVADLRRRLLARLEVVSTLPRVHLLGLLRAYCGLVGRGALVPTDAEVTLLFRAIACAARPSLPERFVQLAFATAVLVCLAKADDARVMKESRQLIKSLYDLDSTHSGSLFTMTALLLYTKPAMVVDVLRSVLDSSVVIPTDRIAMFGEGVLKLDFTEHVMVHGLLAMTPQEDINATMTSPTREMTLRVAYSLLCERSYVRHKVNPTDWVLSQVHAATLPVHPILPNLMLELVENHVAAYDMSAQKSSIPALRAAVVLDAITAVVTHPDPRRAPRVWTRAVLVLVYVLHFNRRYIKDNTAASRKYELHALPVARIFRAVVHASHVGAAFEFVFPLLSRLLLDECPHVLQPLAPPPIVLALPSAALEHAFGHLKASVMLSTDEMPAVRDLLLALDTAPPSQVVSWLDSIVACVLPAAMGALDEPQVSIFAPPSDKLARPATPLAFPDICGLVEAVWTRTLPHHPTPDALKLRLVNALCPGASLSFQNVLEEPFSIIRCDPRVWRHSPLLSLLLDLLTSFRDLSGLHLRQLNTDDAALHASSNMDVGQYILVQDSIMAHALLNVLGRLATEEAFAPCHRLYRWLDTLFRQNPTLLLAVHSQGYDVTLVPLLVSHLTCLYDLMPSMPDLLNSNDLDKLTFRCALAAHLFRKYPDAVSISVLKSVVAKVKLVFDTDRSQTSDKLLSPPVLEFLAAVLPALGAMAVSFPDVAEECVQLLLKLRAQMTHQASDTLNTNAAVAHLDATVHRVFAQIVRSSHE
ncbi:Aste57867_19437 [Aphanomyces stellatus]|uniref:Aste57867_19437 protein n=1 Tax=Aphanomyces stellatus TaxID=120398 RepID=A0A485LCT8_9STRA|nr:hypothetical protein As57867_019373 [Aphanomyces stellatus]VFT96150.1 Aste57867_19437 [Aphanomyces stellatus]